MEKAFKSTYKSLLEKATNKMFIYYEIIEYKL